MTPIAVEAIAADDLVSRHVYFPFMYGEASELFWENVFQFPGGQCESVVWRRFALEDADVHEIGVRDQERKRKRNPEWTYTGFLSAIVQEIRKIETAAGHGFNIIHLPECDADYHTHICYAPGDGSEPSALKRGEKLDLKMWIKNVFKDFTEFATP